MQSALQKEELPFYFQNPAGHLVPSSPLRSPCRLVLQKEKLGVFLYPAGEPKKVAEAVCEKCGGKKSSPPHVSDGQPFFSEPIGEIRVYDGSSPFPFFQERGWIMDQQELENERQ